ncbi:MAG: hypothetical protein QMD22_03550 [archaeon]|nr:hypothetical protein [archaeon]
MNQKTVCIVGIGYVGLPLAEAFSKHLKVVGFDIDEVKIRKLNRDNNEESLEFTSDSSKIKEAYLYSWTINPNVKYYQIPSKSQFPNPKKKGLAKIRYKTGSIGIWDLFGSIGIYWIFGFSTELNKYSVRYKHPHFLFR